MADQAPNTFAAPAATFNAAQWLSHFEAIGGGCLATESQTSICIAYHGTTQEQQTAASAMVARLSDGQRSAVMAHIRARAGLPIQQPVLNPIHLEKLSETAGISRPSSGAALDEQSEGPHQMYMTHAFSAGEALPAFHASAAMDRNADLPRTPKVPENSFEIAAQAWIHARGAMEAHNTDDDIPDALCSVEARAWRNMLSTPAPDLPALRFKLEQLLHIEPAVDAIEAWSGDEVRQTLADLSRLMAPPAPQPHPDATILAAFDVYRSHWSGDAPVDGETLLSAKKVLINTPAATSEGIEAKLRVVVDFIVDESPMSSQGLNAIGTPLVEHLKIDNFEQQMLFHAAQDVGRLGKIAEKRRPSNEARKPVAADLSLLMKPLAVRAVALPQKWGAAMARMEAAKAVMEAKDYGDAATDAFAEAEEDLLKLPAPHCSALLWKLEKIFEPDGRWEFTTSWSRDYVSQTIADYRRLLGGAGMAVGSAAPAPTANLALAWAAVMQNFEVKRAAETAFDRAVFTPAFHASNSGGPSTPDRVSDEMERLADARCGAEDSLIATPAPTLSAVIWKMEYAHKRWEDFEGWPDDWWNSVMSDLLRLAARGNA